MRDFRRALEAELQFMSYAPIIFISVSEKQRIEQVLASCKAVAENRAMRVPTGQLNSLIMDAMMMKQPPSDKGRRLKIYYVTQVGVKPPLFSFQVNDRELVHFSYSRFLIIDFLNIFKPLIAFIVAIFITHIPYLLLGL